MSAIGDFTSDRASRRLDQWLWFARFVKSRSLAARLCAAGAVMVNGAVVAKANYGVRTGDEVAVSQAGWQRIVRVAALGSRRGPAREARALFEETASIRCADLAPAWEPLLFADDDGQ